MVVERDIFGFIYIVEKQSYIWFLMFVYSIFIDFEVDRYYLGILF